MTHPTPDMLRQVIDTLQLGDPARKISDLASIDGLQIEASGPDGAIIRVSLAVDPSAGPILETARQTVEEALNSVDGVAETQVMLTRKKLPEPGNQPSASRPASRQATAPPGDGTLAFPDIRHIVAVGSGKGGVGKSTVAMNLAAAWQQLGWSVGLMDADIYGPSIPILTGQAGRPSLSPDKRIQPLDADGIKAMSIGNMSKPGQALVWRGPMVQGALMQMLRDVDWGSLDVLVIDLPPGTGDVQLTLSQRLKLTGAIIVSTPQDLALIDARRAMAMFDRVAVPVLGLVENMSVFCCPSCGHESHIFGNGGAKHEAEAQNLPFLGAIPLTMPLRELADQGRSLVRAQPDDPAAESLMAIAATLQASLDDPARATRKPPRITWR